MGWVSCEEATTLALAGCDRTLRRGERLRLALHRLFCTPCRIYRRQLTQLRAFSARLNGQPPAPEQALPDDARARLAARLRSAAGERRD